MSSKHLLIIDQIANGGAEKVAIDYYHWLKNRGEEVLIFSLYKPTSYTTEDLRWGLKKNINFLPVKLIQQLILFFKLTFFVFQFRPSTIFSLLERSNLLNTLIPYRAHKIISVRNQLSIQYNKISNAKIKKLIYKIIKGIYNKSQCILAVSENVKNDLIEEFHINPSLINVINNGVDRTKINQRINEDKNEVLFDTTKFNLLSIGRISLQKAHWKLIRAIHYLINKKEHKDIRLTIIGSGELSEELNQLIKNLQLSEIVTIIPFNTNPYAYLFKSDLFVLPSLYEGFPNVLAEAIYLGKPFIGSDAAIPVEIFDKSEFKKQVCYRNQQLNFQLDAPIMNDEIEMALLLEKVIMDKKNALAIVNSTKKWNKNNSRDQQFEHYFLLSKTKSETK